MYEEEILDYNGVLLEKSNVDVLIELEEMLGIPIPIIDDYIRIKNNPKIIYPFGFAQEQNHITVLRLCSDIRAKKLKKLPETIGNLTHLFFFEISGNIITSFPTSFRKLTKLEDLSIITNKSTFGLKDINPVEIPKYIQNFINLKKLSITFDNIVEIPPWIGKITSLEYLHLSDNPDSQHKRLPKTFANLVNLKELTLRCNIVSPFPEIFSHLSNLTKLDLSFNQLSTLPYSIQHLTQLESLNLSNNNITMIPEFIKNFDDSSYNQFTNISIRENPLRSLSNIPKKTFSGTIVNLGDSIDLPLVRSGKFFFHKCSVNENTIPNEIENLYEFYKKSPLQLAQQYTADPKSLTNDEKERLAWEAGLTERTILENATNIPKNDSLIQKITRRLSFGDDTISKIPLNPLRSLHGIQLNQLPRILHQTNKYYDDGTPNAARQLPSCIMDIIRDFRPTDTEIETRYSLVDILSNLKESRDINDLMLWDVYRQYKKSTSELVQQYIENKKSLNYVEKQRLAWEAEIKEFEILKRSLPPEDPVLIKINKRLFPVKPKIKLLR